MSKPQRTSKSKKPKSKELIVVDQIPLRVSAFQRFSQIRSRYTSLRDELHRHKDIVRASYSVWFLHSFQSHLAQLHKLESLHNEKLTLIQRIEEIYSDEDMTYLEATEMAENEAEEAKRLLELERLKNESINSEPKLDDSDSEEESRRLDDDLRDFRESPSPENEEDSEFFGSGLLHDVRNVGVSSNGDLIKFYFRKIAQVVHPDSANRTETGEVESESLLKELWEEATVAEKIKDLDTLKMIYSVLLGQTELMTSYLSLSEVDDQIKTLQRKIKSMQKERSDLARTDSAWGFESANKDELAQIIIFEFQSAQKKIQSSLRAIIQRLAFLKGTTKVIKRKKGSSRHNSRY